jgi:hypothetical protein
MADDLAAFLKARLDEVWESAWRWHLRDCTFQEDPPQHCGCGLPAHLLRDVEAKRAILGLHLIEAKKADITPFDPQTGERNPDEYEVTCDICGWVSGTPGSACPTLRNLAAVYSDHPGYRQEWA